MVDITMCSNKECLQKEVCYRYRAHPSEIQSYCEFKPVDGKCEHLWPICKDHKIRMVYE